MSYADVFEQIVLMQVMLGVKAPKSVVSGNIYGYVNDIALSEVDSVNKSKCKCNKELRSGMCLSAKNSSSSYDSARSNIVVRCKVNDSGTYDVTFKYPNLDTFINNYYAYSYSLANGYCDNVMGTFGTPAEAGLTNSKESFKFMNVEWNTGFYETVSNLIHHGGNDTVGYNPLNGDPEVVSETVPIKNSSYIKDYEISDEGILIPTEGNGTSTTGYRVYSYFNTSSDCTWLVGGYSANSRYGVGYVAASNSLYYLYINSGGRPSTLGGASPEA